MMCKYPIYTPISSAKDSPVAPGQGKDEFSPNSRGAAAPALDLQTGRRASQITQIGQSGRTVLGDQEAVRNRH